jgi:RNA polymerase sigma factor (sigma-70 family)
VELSAPNESSNQGNAKAYAEDEPLILARLAASGNAAATTRLLRLVAPDMLRVVRGVMGRPYSADVDDAIQQALVAFVQSLPSFRGECAPAGYACRIAFRTALALRKSAARVRARFDDAADADAMMDNERPSAVSDQNRRTELVRRLLAEIPTEQAEALSLRIMLGWSLEEIASTSNVPLNTVRSRLRLAKEALRRAIEADPALAEEFGVSP